MLKDFSYKYINTASFSVSFSRTPLLSESPITDVFMILHVNDFFYRIKDQPTFPNFTREHAHQFLHACYWNPIKSKKALQNYCEIRANTPLLFDNRDPLSDSVQNILNMT